jgi:hypothetical protein
MATRTKKTITKNYGSFQLEGLMVQAAKKRVVLKENAKQAAEKLLASEAAKKKAREHLLAYQLCMRQCVCPTEECTWQHYSICPENNCGALISPMSSCFSDICKPIKLAKKKALALKKKELEEANLNQFLECQAAHVANGRRMLTCPCNAEAREDIEIATFLSCKWDGCTICVNPPCNVLLKPRTTCKKRMCQTYRKQHNIQPAAKPRNKTARPAKKSKVVMSSARQHSDTSSSEDSDSATEPTPRKPLHRKSSARSTPPQSSCVVQ